MYLALRFCLACRACIAISGAFLFFAVLFWSVCSHALSSVSSVNVPVDHWSYEALDKLKGFGLIESDIYDIRPYSRIETARLIKEASDRAKDRKLPKLVTHLLGRLKHEFKMEIGEVTSGTASPHFFKPIQEAQVHYAYVDGEPRSFTKSTLPQSAFLLNANDGTPLLPNNQGITYTEHNNFSFQFATSARAFNILSAWVEPIFIARENAGAAQASDFSADIHKAYAKISPWNVELEIGRDSLWIGQGYRGTLLWSSNASPLDMIKLSNPQPVILPWYLSYLGLVKYTMFFAQLEEDRDWPNTMLAGFHVVAKPIPTFEIGVNWTFLFNGDGRPQITPLDVLSTFRLSESRDKVDELGSVDFRLRLPFLRNAEIYAEFGGEDSTGPRWYEFLFRDVGYVVGMYFPVIFDDGRTDLRIEYANNAFERDAAHQGNWYGHYIYTTGYTYQGRIIGHWMGPDSSDLFIRTTHYFTDRIRVGIDYENVQSGLTLSQNVQEMNSAGTDVTYEFNQWLSLTARYAFGRITNFNFVQGDDRNDHLFMAGMKMNF